jgi:hypothetical protein
VETIMRIGIVEAASVVAIGIAAVQLQSPERATSAVPAYAAVKPVETTRPQLAAARSASRPISRPTEPARAGGR